MNSKNYIYLYSLIYQETVESFAMSRYIFMELLYIKFIVQIAFKYFSPILTVSTSCHDFSISFSED